MEAGKGDVRGRCSADALAGRDKPEAS